MFSVLQVQNNTERSDTASRRSILEKRSLWESTEPEQDHPDPAMLPLSQRKALFEKIKSVPKPIARFGESVTPAMIAKANTSVPASEPAWKRQRREKSPEKQSFYTPGHDLRRVGVNDSTTPAVKRVGIETKKNLYENNWKSNDISKAQEEAKRKDMAVLMNRFQKVSEDVERERSRSPQRRNVSPIGKMISPRKSSPSPTRKTPSPTRKMSPPKRSPIKSPNDKYYPGVNSLKKIKVSPPRSGQLYPDLTENFDERPGTSMSDESSAPSEAPSLGTAIKRAASSNKRHSPMKAIAEDTTDDDDEHMDCSGVDDEINDILDEALDVSQSDSQIGTEGGPTPPKLSRSVSPSASSSASWEFQTPVPTMFYQKDYKTPRVDQVNDSPQAELPLVETEEGIVPASNLMHSVSIYRKQKPTGTTEIFKLNYHFNCSFA